MSKSTTIITGEAAETDSEDDCSNNLKEKATNSNSPSSTLQGEIVNGEDSESDTDLKPSAKVSELTKGTVQSSKMHPRKFDSLLHKKLCENNLTVDKNMKHFLSTRVNEATASLNNTDRQLMKSQLTMQAALNSLRVLNANAIQIKNKLRNIVVDDNYLHNLAVTNKWHVIQ